MPIDTRIEGSPEEIRACARWLRRELAAGVGGCVTDLRYVRDEAAWGWQGAAGSAFHGRMDSASQKVNGLRADIEAAAKTFDSYADDLHTAQAGMRRARKIAIEAGLQLDGHLILEPWPTPAPSPPGRSAIPSQVAAYRAASEEADRAREIIDAAKAIGRKVWDSLLDEAVFHVADLVNGVVVRGLVDAHTSILRSHAAALMADSRLAAQRYLKAPGGSPEARRLNAESYKKFLEADKYQRRADFVTRRIGSKIPIIGLGITAAGIGYDIHQGKPAGKAIISGVGGALAAAGTGALVGTAIGGPVGTVVGAGVGLAVGIVASDGLDWGYDQLPDGVRNGIEDGIKEVGSAVGDAGEAVGDGARKAWNAVF